MRDRTGAKNSNYRHGECVGNTSKLYYIWKEVIRRTTDSTHPRYADYGGRGIDVDPRWAKDIRAFLEDVGPRPSAKHSIDRKDNERGYWPGNVRWATVLEQANNTRGNRVITHNGTTQTLSQWARTLKTPVSSLHYRLQTGWSEADAIDTPFRRRPECP